MVENMTIGRKQQGAALVLTLVVAGGALTAQSRMAVRIRSPAAPGRIGQSTSVSRFSQYSYGAGSLSSSPMSTGGDVLRSSIRRSGRAPTLSGYGGSSGSLMQSDVSGGARNFRVARPTVPPFSMPQVPDIGSVQTRGTRLYTPSLPGVNVTPGAGIGGYVQDSVPATAVAAKDYLDLMSGASGGSLDSELSGSVTSLVPDEESPYKDHMSAGETAFRNGDYQTALKEFRLASYLRPHVPEPMIGMLHARFAVAGYSYSMASFQLQEALSCLPELPLVKLDPESFYGNPADYASQLSRLRAYLTAAPNDVEARLVETYYQWFAGQAQDAALSLRKAYQAAKRARNEEALETISTFWAGMTATGRVSGPLDPDAPNKPEVDQPAGPQTGPEE